MNTAGIHRGIRRPAYDFPGKEDQYLSDSSLKVLEEKKNVIFAPGSLYLFWTNGLYYLWELSRNYRIILVVDEAYSRDEIFLKSINLTDVADIIYLPSFGSSYSRHRFYYNEFKRIVADYQPAFILQYNDVYINNIYLFHMRDVLGIDCKRIVFQNARMGFNWHEACNALIDASISMKKNRVVFRTPLWFSRWRARTRSLLDELKEYYLLPLLVAGKTFAPVYDLHSGKFRFTGNTLKKNNKKRFDLYLAYYASEKENSELLQGYSGDISLVAHPVQAIGSECNKAMYDIEEENIISLFPTDSFVSSLVVEKGFSADKIAETTASIWISAINILLNKFPGAKGIWKLHPNAENDPVMIEISKHIEQSCSNVKVLPASDNAQKWILRSKVVVTDVSTIFWWANMLKDKLVISLDLFDLPNGDEARYYEGVLYFKAIEELESYDFNSSTSRENKPSLPTITEVFARLAGGSTE